MRRAATRSGLVLAAALVLALVSCACSRPAGTSAPRDPLEAGVAAGLVSKAGFLKDDPRWVPVGAVTYWELEGREARFVLEDGREARVSFLTPELYRLRLDPAGDFSRDDSYAVVKKSWPPVEVTSRDDPDKITLSTASMTVEITRTPFTLTVSRDGKVLARDTRPIAFAGTRVVAFRDVAPGDRFFGLGEKTGPLMKNGEHLANWSSDTYRYTASTDPSYMSVPFLLDAGARGTWGLLFDNTYQTFFNLAKAQPRELYFGATGGAMDYYFIAGDDVASVVRAYTDLTGRTPLPPKWALGYHQSRYSYMTQREVLDVAATLREKAIPADVIYLDIDFMDGRRSFTYDSARFPDPVGMTMALKAMGFETVAIIDPGVKEDPDFAVFDSGMMEDVFVRDTAGALVRGRVWPGICVFPDFTKPSTVRWWGRQCAALTELGVAGFWNDMNEPSVFDSPSKTLPLRARHWDFGRHSSHAKIHNVYGHAMARATYLAARALRPGLRPFVLSRAGYAGSQRFGAFWTGDNQASWEHLRLNITMVLNMGLSGFALAGADVGGYAGDPSRELFARWMEVGSLMPFFRNHTEGAGARHEPWAFGAAAEVAARKAISRRYTLIPYYYDLAHEAATRGDPIVRPLFYEVPDDQATYEIEDELLVGRSLLAAPVVTEGARSRRVYLPAGVTWLSWDGKRRFAGGRSYSVHAPLHVLPLFVRAGGIIPTQDVQQWVGQLGFAPLEIRVYPDGGGVHHLYLDDGVTMDYATGDYLETRIESSAAEDCMWIGMKVRNLPDRYRPPFFVFLRIPGIGTPSSVRHNGGPVPLALDPRAAAAAEVTTAWGEKDGSLLIKLFHLDEDHLLRIDFASPRGRE